MIALRTAWRKMSDYEHFQTVCLSVLQFFLKPGQLTAHISFTTQQLEI
jgi:hypothetical protein